ncbi:MAG: adenine nucleotide alpha hydrolase [Litoreibacter sp.]
MPTDRSGLESLLARIPLPVIALSGGVDSMTLAALSHMVNPKTRALHALSPAVPKVATRRVKDIAAQRNWSLDCVDAGEFADPNYLENPLNRCFYCKTNLYETLSQCDVAGQILSGTNLDDLGDYRPGLIAAKAHNVRHPFVDTGYAKSDVRALARDLDLGEIAALPAAPCLSSRIETGLRIDPQMLALIETVETWLTDRVGSGDLRCRILKTGIEIQMEERLLNKSGDQTKLGTDLRADLPQLGARAIRISPYVKGSAFVGDKTAAALVSDE